MPSKFSPRSSLLLLVALLLAVLFLTASRLHNASPAFSHFVKDWSYRPSISSSKVTPTKDAVHDGTPPQGLPYAPTDSKPVKTNDSPLPNPAIQAFCSHDLDLLRQKDPGLTQKVLYTRRCIRPIHKSATDPDILANVTDDPFFTSTVALNLQSSDSCIAGTKPPPCEPLTLHVPPAYPDPTDSQYRHFLFGVASTYERVESSLPVFKHWMANTGARIVFVITDARRSDRPLDLDALRKKYRAEGMRAEVISPQWTSPLPRKNNPHPNPDDPTPTEQLHFLMIRDMLHFVAHPSVEDTLGEDDEIFPEVHWLGVLDDDTFFPHLRPVSKALSRYNHSQPLYLGALSDNFHALQNWGYIAFGGAGVFLSVPLAQQLNPLLETCLAETDISSGDGMLAACVYAKTTAKLTLVPGLWQHDIRGDPSGVFEGGRGRPMLSLHHWKSWYHAPVREMAGVVKVCGGCFLQRWRFWPPVSSGEDDGSLRGREAAGQGTPDAVVLTNGWSISVYQRGSLAEGFDLDWTEATFDGAPGDGRYDFTYGPFRRRMEEHEKKSYRLVLVDGPKEVEPEAAETASKSGWGSSKKVGGKRKFRQIYVHKAKEEGGMDEVVELVWEV